MQTYEAKWTGKARTWASKYPEDDVYVAISGTLIFQAEDDDEARTYADRESEQLFDVDFVAPGRHSLSAANRNVLSGTCTEFGPSWEFDDADVRTIRRCDNGSLIYGTTDV